MKKLFVLAALLFSAAVGSNIYAQQDAPPGASGTDLRDTDVKRRSIEMERIEREAKKTGKTETDRLAPKYGEIKEDHEHIQLSQDAIVKVYQTGSKIDYARIGKHAAQMHKSAKRLNSNLFEAAPDEKTGAKKDLKKMDKTEANLKKNRSVRDLIIDLDNAVGSFATSPMFQDLRVIDPKVSKKTKLDLGKIIELSALLSAEAERMSAGEKEK